MKTNKLKYFILFLLILFTNQIHSQQIYISPVPGSKFHNPETSIILKFESPVKLSSLKSNLFNINGSYKEYSDITYETSDDQKTIILKTGTKFEYGDTIFVTTNNAIELEVGLKINIPDFSFQIRSYKSKLNNTNNKFLNNIKSKNEDYFPPITVNINNNPANGKIFFYNISAFASANDRFYAIIENDGTPFFARQDSYRGVNFTLQKNGYLTFWNNKNFYMLDSSYSVIDSFACGNGYEADWHELQVLKNGHAFLISWDEIKDKSQIGDGNQKYAYLQGLIIQEIDNNKNVVFQWRSCDYFDDTKIVDNDSTKLDVRNVHGNAIEIDYDGNILASLRGMDEIIKIDRNTGDIIWRLGGVYNEFTFINDEGFCGQHDIRRLSNGNITLYDNGTCHTPPISKAKEYHLNEITKTATLVWEYEHPKKNYCAAMGNVQRLNNGNTFINWGQIADSSMIGDNLLPAITEVRPDKSIAYELTFNTYFHLLYRSYRFEWDVDVDTTAVLSSSFINYNSNINIFPNPSKDILTIQLNSDNFMHLSYSILNAVGQIILNSKFHSSEESIDISILDPGLYFVKINSKNNIVFTKTIIVI